MAVPPITFDDPKAVIKKRVEDGGRLWGLGDYIGCEVVIIVPKEAKLPPRKPRGVHKKRAAGGKRK